MTKPFPINATPGGDTNVKLPTPKVLQCVFFYETSQGDGMLAATRLVQKANALLAPHNLEIRLVDPGLRTGSEPGFTFTYDFPLTGSSKSEETASLFNAAKQATGYDPPLNVLPVLFATRSAGGVDASTDPVPSGNSTTRPAIEIFGNARMGDDVTLLHEMGHAAGLWPGATHPPWDDNNPGLQNIMCSPVDLPQDKWNNPPLRGSMKRSDVQAFASASFAVPERQCQLRPL